MQSQILPSLLNARKGYFGHSWFVIIVEIISLSSENLGRADYTAPVYLFVTGIVDFDTHNSLFLIEVVLKTATSGEEYIRNNVYI